MAKKNLSGLKVGDRISYDYHEGTIISLGCEYCSVMVVEDDRGNLFTPASPWKITKLS